MTTFKNPQKLSCKRNPDPFGFFDCIITDANGKKVKFAAGGFDMELNEKRPPTEEERENAFKRFPFRQRGSFSYKYPKNTTCVVSGNYKLTSKNYSNMKDKKGVTIKTVSCRIPASALHALH